MDKPKETGKQPTAASFEKVVACRGMISSEVTFFLEKTKVLQLKGKIVSGCSRRLEFGDFFLRTVPIKPKRLSSQRIPQKTKARFAP